MPTSRSKNSRCATRGHARSIPRRRWAGESVTNRSGSSAPGRMLHRPPPLIRILRPPSRVRSMTMTEDRSAANIAAINPAAPAPATTMEDMREGQRAQGAYLMGNTGKRTCLLSRSSSHPGHDQTKWSLRYENSWNSTLFPRSCARRTCQCPAASYRDARVGGNVLRALGSDRRGVTPGH